jgi:hypothetical protein
VAHGSGPMQLALGASSCDLVQAYDPILVGGLNRVDETFVSIVGSTAKFFLNRSPVVREPLRKAANTNISLVKFFGDVSVFPRASDPDLT